MKKTLNKKKNFQTCFFVLLILKNFFFISSIKHIFIYLFIYFCLFEKKQIFRIQFSNTILFLKTLKTIF